MKKNEPLRSINNSVSHLLGLVATMKSIWHHHIIDILGKPKYYKIHKYFFNAYDFEPMISVLSEPSTTEDLKH